MLSSDGLENQIVGLQSVLLHGPSWVALGGNLAREQRKRMGRVVSGTGEDTGEDPGESFFDYSGRRLNFVNYVETYSDSQCDHFPRTLLRLNILGQSYLPWLLLVVMEEVKCATVRRSLLFLTVSTSIDFFFPVGKSQSGRGIKN